MADGGTSAPSGALQAARRRAGRARWDVEHYLRRKTVGRRALPAFVILGAQKAGTTSLYRYLTAHPDVQGPWRKELHHFDHDGPEGSRQPYQANFPYRSRLGARADGRPRITGEGSPVYLLDPRAPARMAAQLPAPGPLLIVLHRDPADRAWSQYRMNVRNGFETMAFVDALRAEPDRLASWRADPLVDHPAPDDSWRYHSYCARGRYAEQLDRWVEHFPRERILIERAEDLFRDPKAVYDRTLRFLGLAPFDEVEFERHNLGARPGEEMPDEARRIIADAVADDQERFAKVLSEWPAVPAGDG